MKMCGRCKAVKASAEFGRNASRVDGLSFECKACKRERDRQYRVENREALAERMRQYYVENREALAERQRQYYVANREAIAEREREINDATRIQSSSHGLPWTAPEDAIAARTDITNTEKAFMLGRSLVAVTNRAQNIRHRTETTS